MARVLTVLHRGNKGERPKKSVNCSESPLHGEATEAYSPDPTGKFF
jgi:hypothetical protein